MTDWISVEDRLPDEPGIYIVAWLNGEVSAFELDELDDVDQSVTHWMPLPEKPA
jgi:hypothetical protein